MSNVTQVLNSAQLISAPADVKTAISSGVIPAYADLDVPTATGALFDSEGIRMIAEPVAAMAGLTGHSRVLIAGCRQGDGASTVASALALDLAVRMPPKPRPPAMAARFGSIRAAWRICGPRAASTLAIRRTPSECRSMAGARIRLT